MIKVKLQALHYIQISLELFFWGFFLFFFHLFLLVEGQLLYNIVVGFVIELFLMYRNKEQSVAQITIYAPKLFSFNPGIMTLDVQNKDVGRVSNP